MSHIDDWNQTKETNRLRRAIIVYATRSSRSTRNKHGQICAPQTHTPKTKNSHRKSVNNIKTIHTKFDVNIYRKNGNNNSNTTAAAVKSTVHEFLSFSHLNFSPFQTQYEINKHLPKNRQLTQFVNSTNRSHSHFPSLSFTLNLSSASFSSLFLALIFFSFFLKTRVCAFQYHLTFTYHIVWFFFFCSLFQQHVFNNKRASISNKNNTENQIRERKKIINKRTNEIRRRDNVKIKTCVYTK